MIYIGLDAHMSTCSFCVMDRDGVIKDEVVLPTNGRMLVGYLENLPGPKKLTFEECELSRWLYSLFRDRVTELLVCNPVENISYKRSKTDKLDARRLADLLRGGYLSPVYHDAGDREKLRDTVSAYLDLVQEGTRLKNRFKSLFRKSGIHIMGTDCHEDVSVIGRLPKDMQTIAASLRLVLLECQKQEEALRRKIKEFCDLLPEAGWIDSIPCLGSIRTAMIISQVIDPHRFENKYKFFSYCGLVRKTAQSGGKTYTSRKNHGNTILKSVYYGAAHLTVTKEKSAFRLYYDRLRSEGRSDRQARQALARKIAAVSLAVWKHKRLFNKEKFFTKAYQQA